jgi:hypothetical protein
MSKTQTLRQSAAASNETRVVELASRIEELRQAKHQSVEELAAALEPIAQAMAALTDETRKTLAEIEGRTQGQGETFTQQLNTSAKNWKDAAAQAQQAAESLDRAGSRLEWTHYALAIATALLTAVLVSVFWLWLAPPMVENQLDAKAVAQHLKPAVIEALKPSRGK